jgi:hypothetical protein
MQMRLPRAGCAGGMPHLAASEYLIHINGNI